MNNAFESSAASARKWMRPPGGASACRVSRHAATAAACPAIATATAAAVRPIDHVASDSARPPSQAATVDVEAGDEMGRPRERSSGEADPLQRLGARPSHSRGESCTATTTTASTLTKTQ